MLLPRFVLCAFLVGLANMGSGVVLSQTYPTKAIRIITAEVGGGVDFTARLIAQGLSPDLGQQVIVENRGGANGAIAGEMVAISPPDGYTLLLYGSPIWLAPFLRNKVPYDPVRDFSAITLAVSVPAILAVHPSLPVGSVKELIALAKANPGKLNYASGSSGSSTHLATELFKWMAEVNIVYIPFKGSTPALNTLLGGQVQVMFATVASVTLHVKSGRLRALAVSTAEPSTLTPGLPTVAASGLLGYESVSIYGVFAPAKTPATIINRLNQDIVRVLNRPDVKDKFLNVGIVTIGSSPEQFAAIVKSEMARMGKVIRDVGIRDN